MEFFLKQFSMCYNPISHNINHHRLKYDVDTQLTVALHTLNNDTAHTAVSTSQPPIQPKSIPFWADEVVTGEQSRHFTPKTVAYSGKIRGARLRSQPMA